MKTAALFGLCLLGACGTVDFEKATRGDMRGDALVLWVGSGENSRLGNGRFIYVPFGDRALEFERKGQKDPEKSITIRPEPFYTDGGSIPRVIQAFPGFAAWGYGPAYIIHDWVFVARKCLNMDRRAGTDTASEEIKKIEVLDFQDSADLLAEAIKTLDGKPRVPRTGTGRAIASATAGPISLRRWQENGPCVNLIDPDHQDHIDRLIAQTKNKGGIGTLSLDRTGPTVLVNGEVIEVIDIISVD